MKTTKCWRVIVKNDRDDVVKDFWSLFFSTLTVKTANGKIIVTKKGWFKEERFIVSDTQSVLIKKWA